MISPSTRIDGRAFEKRYNASAPRADAVRSRRSSPPVRGGATRGDGSARTPVRERGNTTAGSVEAASMAEGASLAAFRADRGADGVASPAAFGSDLAGVPRFRRSSIHTSSPPRAATTVNRSPGADVEGWSSLSTAPYSASACSASAGRISDRRATMPSSVIGACVTSRGPRTDTTTGRSPTCSTRDSPSSRMTAPTSDSTRCTRDSAKYFGRRREHR